MNEAKLARKVSARAEGNANDILTSYPKRGEPKPLSERHRLKLGIALISAISITNKRRSEPTFHPQQTEPIPSFDHDSERGFVTEHRRRAVAEALAKLPAQDQQILKMLFLEEADTDAVCRSFDIEKDYLKVLVQRAKSRFRNALTNVEAQRDPHQILLSGSARKKALNRFHELADLQLQGLASKSNLKELAEIDRMLSAETAPLEYTRALETLANDRKLLRESMSRIESLLSRSSLNKTA